MIELSDEEFEVHGPRLRMVRYANAAAFYLGHHWAWKQPVGDQQLVFNYVRALSDFLTNFCFSKGVSFNCAWEFQHIIPALLDRAWDTDNDKSKLLWEIGNMGSIYGDVFVKVSHEDAFMDDARMLHPPRVRIIPLNPAHCFPTWHPHDRSRMESFKLKYKFWSTAPDGTRLINTYCVDDETEVLTKDGWKHRWDIQATDELLSVDQTSKDITWEPLQKLNVFDWDGPLTRWQGEKIDALTTPDHRWLARQGRTGDRPLKVKRTHEFTPGRGGDQLYLGGGTPAHFPSEKVYSDEFVELMAWVVNEGYYRHTTQGERAVVVTQSLSANPDYVERIRLLSKHFAAQGCRTREYARTGRDDTVVDFFFSGDLGAQIRNTAPEKQITVAFLGTLTEVQARLFYQTCIDADGHRRMDTGLNTWAQKDQGRIDSFQMLAAMLGTATATHPHGEDCSSVSVYRTSYSAFRYLKVSEESYTGKVWCPTVRTGTWLARRNGVTYWTGNCEIITPSEIREYLNDQLCVGSPRPNPLGRIPIVHIANAPAAGSPWGLSDVWELIPLNREYNEKATEISTIINYHAAPITVITGGKPPNLEKGPAKIWGLGSDKAKVFNLAGGFQGLAPAMEFLDRIKTAMHELAGVNANSLGEEQAISNTSGVALSIQYMPTTMKFGLKKIMYGKPGLCELNKLILMTLFQAEPNTIFYDPNTDGIMEEGQPPFIDPSDPDVYNTECVWDSPLPVDILILLEQIQQKLALRLESRKGALRELGEEFPDEKLRELFDEQKTDAIQEGAFALIKAQITAYILEMTGQQMTDDSEQPPPPQTDADGKPVPQDTPPAVQGAPPLPPMNPVVAGMIDEASNNIYSQLVTEAYGPKRSALRDIDKNSNS